VRTDLFLQKNNFRLISIGQNLFYLGIFLLPSAISLSTLVLLISLVISFKVNKNCFLKDKWNLLLLFCSFLLFISCAYNQINSISNDINYWVGLFNLIPLFFVFFTFQFYLNTFKKRYIFSIVLLIGSFPVFFSCITQSWFNWYGPYELFDGLIIWFQKPLQKIDGNSLLANNAVSGLFSNANYTGQWLSMLFPFSLVLIFKKKHSYLRRIVAILLTILIVYLIILTNSRNSFLGITIAIPIIFSLKGVLFLITLTLLFSILYSFSFLSIAPLGFKELISSIVPNNIFEKFLLIFNNNHRVGIWKEIIMKIFQKPFLGWGAGTISLLLLVHNGENLSIKHAHNLFLELAHNYGLPLAFTLSLIIFMIIFKSSRIIYSKENNFENLFNKAWLSSCLIILFFHLSDVTYYDGRVSISLWTLLAGLKTLIDEKGDLKTLKN